MTFVNAPEEQPCVYNVTVVTHHNVTQSYKQPLKRLYTVPVRWPEQALCDLCGSVCPRPSPVVLFAPWLGPVFLSAGPSVEPLWGPAPGPFLFKCQHNLCNVTARNSLRQIPLSFFCWLLSLTQSPASMKALAFSLRLVNFALNQSARYKVWHLVKQISCCSVENQQWSEVRMILCFKKLISVMMCPYVTLSAIGDVST